MNVDNAALEHSSSLSLSPSLSFSLFFSPSLYPHLTLLFHFFPLSPCSPLLSLSLSLSSLSLIQ